MAALRYLYFPGCKLAASLPQYDQSVRAVLGALDITLVDAELNCCGYPVRHLDLTASVLCGARILARALQMGLPVMTPCKCCFGNLKQSTYWLRTNKALRRRVGQLLKNEDLQWSPDVTVHHLLTALNGDVGPDRIRKQVTNPLKGVRVAAHYGCHALRPGDVTQFDNPLAPVIFEKMIAATGASAVQWPLRLDCCGHPLWEKNNRMSLALTARKLADAQAADAGLLVTACTYCQMQFDGIWHEQQPPSAGQDTIPAVVYSQLLGAAFGLPPDVLGLAHHAVTPQALLSAMR